MDATSGDPIADLLTAVTIASNAVGADPRIEQVLTEVFVSVEAGDNDEATRVMREFLHSVCTTAAAAHAGVLTGPVVDEVAQMFVEGFVRRRGRPCAADGGDCFRVRAPGGFGLINPTAGPA